MEFRGAAVYGRIVKGAKYVKLQVTKQRDGKTGKFRVRKRTPRRCSAVRVICIECRTSVIHKSSREFKAGKRICRGCACPMPSAIVAAGPGARIAVAGPGPHPDSPAIPAGPFPVAP